MKKFIHKIQDLSQKAAHLKQALEAAPGQAAQLRESVLMTAGQLQQLRQDVQSNVTGLRADNDARLAQALREIHDSARTFLEAGYALTGVDMDLSPVQRLIVHLEKLETISETTMRSLLSLNSSRPTVYAILASMAKADAVSEKMHVPHLAYRKLVVHVGPTPSVRLCWRSDEVVEVVEHEHAAPATAAAVRTPPPIPVTSTPAAAPSAFVQSSYFEQRSIGAIPRSAPPATTVPEAVVIPPALGPASTGSSSPSYSRYGQPHEAPAGGDWKSSALDRFKKMPDGSKYRR
jgi:hypothetical protein